LREERVNRAVAISAGGEIQRAVAAPDTRPALAVCLETSAGEPRQNRSADRESSGWELRAWTSAGFPKKKGQLFSPFVAKGNAIVIAPPRRWQTAADMAPGVGSSGENNRL